MAPKKTIVKKPAAAKTKAAPKAAPPSSSGAGVEIEACKS